jgi:hypothetical protein
VTYKHEMGWMKCKRKELSKNTIWSTNSNSNMVAHDLCTHHCQRFTLCRIHLKCNLLLFTDEMDVCYVGTFPGIMEEPGSFSGKRSSPRPQRGPLPKNRISFAIFMRDTATVFNDPLTSTSASWAANASNCQYNA